MFEDSSTNKETHRFSHFLEFITTTVQEQMHPRRLCVKRDINKTRVEHKHVFCCFVFVLCVLLLLLFFLAGPLKSGRMINSLNRKKLTCWSCSAPSHWSFAPSRRCGDDSSGIWFEKPGSFFFQIQRILFHSHWGDKRLVELELACEADVALPDFVSSGHCWLVSYLVLWAQSTTKDYIRAENKLIQSVS